MSTEKSNQEVLEAPVITVDLEDHTGYTTESFENELPEGVEILLEDVDKK